MIKKTAFCLVAAGSLAIFAGAPAQADPAPPLFDIPIEILPHIPVPPSLHDLIVGWTTGLHDQFLGYNQANPGTVPGIAGPLGAILCAMSTGSAQPCAPVP